MSLGGVDTDTGWGCDRDVLGDVNSVTVLLEMTLEMVGAMWWDVSWSVSHRLLKVKHSQWSVCPHT